ncbi:hypothetical protein BGZ60DRAFT_534450 [Tricladium varicosporioides]|nr:hypothetical protein BGZ60DRAFT_534450 [Hymenoscyphus varicosporioides]
MQLSLIPTAFPLFLTLTSLASSSILLHVRQATLDLPNSLCAFNLDSTNDHTIDAQCDTGFAIVNSKVLLEECLTNTSGELSFLAHGGFSTTCNRCTLDSAALDFSCVCNDGNGKSIVSTINLNAINPNDSGIFLKDNGHIACRSPLS